MSLPMQPYKKHPIASNKAPMLCKDNPWKEDLERLSSQPRPDPELIKKTNARLDDLVEQVAEEPKRKADGTTVKMKMWWGKAVATWDPADAKNINPKADQKHPKMSRWFN